MGRGEGASMEDEALLSEEERGIHCSVQCKSVLRRHHLFVGMYWCGSVDTPGSEMEMWTYLVPKRTASL